VLPERGLLNERFLSLDEMKRLIEAAPEPYKTYLWILTETGVRAGEIGALPLRNLRLEQGAIKITQSVWHGKIQTVKSLKGKPALRNLSSTGRAPAAVRPPVATESTRSSLRDEKRYAMGYRRSAQKKTVHAA
jgi:integrase